MCAGLGITAVVAYSVAQSPSVVRTIAGNQVCSWGLVIAQLGIVFFLSARVDKIAGGTASLLRPLLRSDRRDVLVHPARLHGRVDCHDVRDQLRDVRRPGDLPEANNKPQPGRLGKFLFMGLIGVVLASIVGNLWQNSAFQFVLGFIGVIVFTGLTAYNAQRLKQMAVALPSRTGRLLRDRRGAHAVSRFHQSVSDAPAVHRQQARVARVKKV